MRVREPLIVQVREWLRRSPWRSVAVACVALAALSLLANITSRAELEGGWQAYSFVRKTLTKVLSSGTAWAGLAFYAGLRLPRPITAFLGGIAAAVGALVLHYVAGTALGIYPGDILQTNVIWFAAALILCGPLGLMGWAAARPDWWALPFRIVVPAGAVTEAFVMRHFTPWPEIPWPERYSAIASGVLLVALGVISGAIALLARPRLQE